MPDPPDTPPWLDGEALARLAAAERDAVEDEVAERLRADSARTLLADRWRASYGRSVSVTLAGGHHGSGVVVDAGADWALLRGPAALLLVRLGSVTVAEGLARDADPGGPTAARLGPGHALRRLTATGRAARALLVDGATVEGTLVRVLADGCDLIRHPRDRAPLPDDAVVAVSWQAVSAVGVD